MSTSTHPIVAEASIRPGLLVGPSRAAPTFVQRFTPADSNLDLLSAGEWHLPPSSRTGLSALPAEEALLFQWRGHAVAEIDGKRFELAPYDTLYVPRGAALRLHNPDADCEAKVIQCSAPATNVHPIFHARFAELSKREDRIRHLKGRDVFLMFDVGEGADKLVAGYTFFQPNTRSWPPHNHTDQEEVYIFINGEGGMQVYESDENLTFVRSVREGDYVTIPLLNYHPVFSQESPLEFIWCIAGERYWVGDKNKEFMKGTGQAITT
jgi:mannose-6-phosphate isomerase-like protein (cupin superfamily)